MRIGSMIKNNSDLQWIANKCPKTKSIVTAPIRPHADAIPIAVARIYVGYSSGV